MVNQELSNSETAQGSSILDRIMGSQTQSNLSEFDPLNLILDLLSQLKERDREILSKRFGPDGQEIETLETIGKRYSLTRERVRQIEKDSLLSLKKKKNLDLDQALQLIFDSIAEHGNIVSETMLLQNLLVNKNNPKEMQGIKFLLNLGEQFKNLKESEKHNESWYIVGFNLGKLAATAELFEDILKEHNHVLAEELLLEKFKNTDHYRQNQLELTDKALKSYLNISKMIQINPFSEIGLKHWSEVKPRDVGDKAYLVLKHHGKPEHYSVITKMINDSKFDQRAAYQETVHNELIKDPRFVLVGRGIYALVEWGYQKGVVSEVIKGVIKSHNRPMAKDEIIAEVLKQRQVKRNTVLVALSNKKNFTRNQSGKYTVSAEI